MSQAVYDKIIAKLDRSGCEYKTSHHAETRTSEDAARIRGVSLHEGAKALVTKGKKTKRNYLFVIPADIKLDNAKAKQVVGEQFGFERDTESAVDCVPGSVPPFGSVLGIETFVDRRLSENQEINFNIGMLTDSVNMAYKDYIFIEKPKIVDIVQK